MEQGHKHFSHPHTLSFHKFFVRAERITCNACSLTCRDSSIYSCGPCRFFLHDQCFNATRSLIHPSHPGHPLSLSTSPTYSSGSFLCNLCHKTGSGLCFCCSTCEFDLHVHCAYNDLNPKQTSNPTPSQNPSTPNQIQLKSHPNHPLVKFRPEPPYVSNPHSCDVCGTACDPSAELYRCEIGDYYAHIGCTRLPGTVRREDHEHVLSLLYVKPHPLYKCSVCRGMILPKNCMYSCSSGCDYGVHVKCASAKVSKEEPMNEKMFQLEMLKQQNQMREYQMEAHTRLLSDLGYHPNRILHPNGSLRY